MVFLTLKTEVIFDATDGEGRLFQVRTGDCFLLDRVATLILQACLTCSCQEEVLEWLHLQLEASDQQLEAGVHVVREQLLAWNLLGPASDLLRSIPSSLSGASELLEETDQGCAQHGDIQKYSTVKARDWEIFLTGNRESAPLPFLSLPRRCYALGKTALLLLNCWPSQIAITLFPFLLRPRQLQRLQTHQWKVLCATLAALPGGSRKATWPGKNRELLARMARRELIFCQCLTRVLAPNARCLVRSGSFACYLRALGFDASLVLGRERFDIPDGFAFHAWVELAGQAVNDLEELQTGYAVLCRIPAASTPSGLC